MPIKDFLIPNYLNDLEEQDANIEQMRSGANLNNAQSSRIMSLLPGELAKQGVDVQGGQLDNSRKGLEIEGQSILNNLNTLKLKAGQFENRKLEVEALAAQNNMDIAQEQERAKTLQIKAQTQEAAAQTRNILSGMNIDQRKAYTEEYYPKAAAAMDLVSRLASAGDIPGANKVYQQLLKTFPPEFLQFEGKNGVDLIGPEIDQKDLEILQHFTGYLKEMSPSNSQIGMLQRQRESDDAAMSRAEVSATGKYEDPNKADKLELEVDKARKEKISTPLAQGISGGSSNKGGIFNEDGVIDSPTVSYAYNKLLKMAVKADKDGKDVVGGMSKVFEVAEMDTNMFGMGGTKIIVPRNENHLKLFLKAIDKYTSSGMKPEEAYQKTFDYYINTPSIVENIFN
jgi:hypothetical protein